MRRPGLWLLLTVTVTSCAPDQIVTARSPNVAAPTTATSNFSIQSMCPAPYGGIVAWWRGDLSGTDAAGTNPGALLNGLTFSTSGKIGPTFVFDGFNDDLFVAQSSAIDVGVGAGFTMEAWIFPQGVGVTGVNGSGPIFEFENGTNFWQAASVGLGGLSGTFITPTGSTGLGLSNVVTQNTWNHVALTYDKASGNAVLYVNGVAKATKNVGSFTSKTNTVFHLGNRSNNSFRNNRGAFKGAIDDAKMYNRALSAIDISKIYTRGVNGACQLNAVLTPPSNVFEGSNGVFTTSASTGQASTHMVFNNGAGSGFNGSFVPSVTTAFTDNGTFTATLVLTDGTLASSTTASYTVLNAVPNVSLTLLTPTPIHAGTQFTLRAFFRDPGNLDKPWTYTLYRNGNVAQTGTTNSQPPPGGTPIDFTFNNPSTQTFQLDITDKDGATGSATLVVTIVP